MVFNIKPKIERYAIYPLRYGWGIIDLTTGELLKGKEKHRLEKYARQPWAEKRCKELNQQKD